MRVRELAGRKTQPLQYVYRQNPEKSKILNFVVSLLDGSPVCCHAIYFLFFFTLR